MHRRCEVIRLKTVVSIFGVGKAVAVDLYKVGPNTVQITVVYPDYKKIWGIASWDNLWTCLFLPQGDSMHIGHQVLKKISHPEGKWSNHLKLHFKRKDKKTKIKVNWKDFRDALLAIK